MVNYSSAAALDVLADPTRRAMVALLAERPRPAGEFADHFRISRPAVSRHLRLLRSRGIVQEFRVRKDGRVRMYRLRGERLGDVAGWATQLQAFWRLQLESFKEFVGAEVDRETAQRRRYRVPMAYRGRGRS